METAYWDSLKDSIPRLLAQIDRNLGSKTYGCCDRTYWHYKTVDFPSARYQETALTLALLYSNKLPGNQYYKNSQVLEWCSAIVNYWAGMQEHNGSFNEWYPHESSFVATTYSTYAISEVMLVLGSGFRNRHSDAVAALEKAAKWLSRQRETRVWNQQAGAVVAMYNLHLLTGKDEYKKTALEKMLLILRNQSSEGWWREYEGPDIGYLSLMAANLAKYYDKSKDDSVLPALRKCLEFLSYMLHPDMTTGGVYGCRNTAYFIPLAAELMAGKIGAAEAIARHLRRALLTHETVSPISLDDRYLSYIGYEWLQAQLVAAGSREKKLPYTRKFSKNFPEARIFVHSSAAFYLIINYAKGGAFMLSSKKRNISYSDGGIVLEQGGRRLASGVVSNKHKATIAKGAVSVTGPLFLVRSHLPTSLRIFAFRVVQAFSAKLGLSLFVKKMLRNKLISEAKASGYSYSRKFVISDKQITVTDSANADRKCRILAGIPLTFIYVPSTNFFQKDQLYSCIAEAEGSMHRTYSDEAEVSVTSGTL